MNIRDELPAFEQWFASVWVGEPPTIQDANYGEYLEARQLALGAWMHRAALENTDAR